MTPTRTSLVLVPLIALAGCATLGNRDGQSLVPTKYQTRTGPYLVSTNFPMPEDSPPILHLQSLERQLQANLGVRVDPAADPIEVYILNDRDAFTHFLQFHYPELPPRRAFFLAQGNRRVVYTYMGDRLEEDLRHEATHALLHAAVAELPLWLDEGLAEYFEGADGLNAEHLQRLPADLAEGWTPDLPHLEALRDVRQMTPRDYRESWAWVHYLLNQSPAARTTLLGYLADIRTRPDAEPLSARLAASGLTPGNALVAHLDRLQHQRSTAALPARHEPMIRLQSTIGEAAPAAPRRRSLIGRIASWFGF